MAIYSWQASGDAEFWGHPKASFLTSLRTLKKIYLNQELNQDPLRDSLRPYHHATLACYHTPLSLGCTPKRAESMLTTAAAAVSLVQVAKKGQPGRSPRSSHQMAVVAGSRGHVPRGTRTFVTLQRYVTASVERPGRMSANEDLCALSSNVR